METLAQAMQRVKASTTLKAFCDARLTARPQDGRDRYACPNPSCMSGKSGRQGSDAAFHLYVNGRGEQRYKCSSCDIEGDVFDLAGILEGTTDTAEQCNTVAAFAGVEGWHRDRHTSGETRPTRPRTPPTPRPTPRPRPTTRRSTGRPTPTSWQAPRRWRTCTGAASRTRPCGGTCWDTWRAGRTPRTDGTTPSGSSCRGRGARTRRGRLTSRSGTMTQSSRSR